MPRARSTIMELPEQDRDDLRTLIDVGFAYLSEYGTPEQRAAIERMAQKYAPDIAQRWSGGY